MASRHDIRQAAFLLSFEKLFLDEELESLFEGAEELGEFLLLNDDVKDLVRCVFDKQEELDSIISKYSDKRALNRIPKVDLAVLRIAIYEALYDDKVPVNVAISEAVSLTEKYALEPDVSFVNGLLGAFSKELKKDEG
ncbi:MULTISPECIES: transcription antitermination factor NusB [Ruminococcus]|uniref:Transcription antitermination protein NusB n=1 Tax=Ruminococcus albus 8 TaxID=246199 RepID=E9SFL7_RUMAL|nr:MULTISPECIES: transcription antitermination factor NusB [Ruminococcus]MBE6873053.1 transcription antitermination factor NusB [Ruminococcus albus]EGC01715.1 transcription antitermination factor NusB [Ruminococcus albus 8]MBQ9543084.1 transcription antitermination factor NusB [Ruminococcus sp.]MBR0528178.1 transcription antitermination factor NusB [Ruminococcus sp.]MCC3352731.1 transcription antitermination factor NusB [Ruminococcus albus 8]